MQIQTTDEIEGVPLLTIHALFRQAGLDGVVSADLVGRQLNLTKAKTDRVISALRRLGFLEAIRARRGVRRAEKRVATVQERNSPPRARRETAPPRDR